MNYDSEAAARAWRAIIALEEIYRWLLVCPVLFKRWRRNRWFKELPPICHNSTVID